MGKRIVFGGLAVFVAWSVLDFVLHGVILKSSYAATASLWRPMGEMKMGVMYLAILVVALAFAAIYGWLVAGKGSGTGLRFGLLWGIGTGVSFGYGSYAVMPIAHSMAFAWFAGTLVEGVVAGWLVGLIVKE